jgi:hypothetical protein
VHVLISETMLNALHKEPQVSIFLNLVPQVHPDALVIPQSIIVDAGLLSLRKREQNMFGQLPKEDCYKMLATVMELNKANILAGRGNLLGTQFVKIPAEFTGEYSRLALFTTIQVFADNYLSHWQSSLNMPQILVDLRQDKLSQVELNYFIDKKPGFRITNKSSCV